MIGIHDDYRGQSPKAFVKLKAGAAAFTLAELQAFLKERLGKHEMVQALDIRAELPKTPVGKLSKKELYEEEAEKKRASGRRGLRGRRCRLPRSPIPSSCGARR